MQRLALAMIMLLLVSVPGWAGGGDENFEVLEFGDYKFIKGSADRSSIHDGQHLYVLHKGKGIKSFTAFPLSLELREDLTGNGIPNAVISLGPSGSGSFATTILLEMASKPKFIEMPSDYSGIFTQLDDDKAFEYQTNSRCHSFAALSNAGRPAPRVIYDLQNGEYRPSISLMRKPPLTEQEVRKLVAHFVNSDGNSRIFIRDEKIWKTYPNSLSNFIKVILDLIYSGRANQAREIYDKVSTSGALFVGYLNSWDDFDSYCHEITVFLLKVNDPNLPALSPSYPRSPG